MAKTLVDVDDELLAQVATELGTRTKKDTINSALRDVLRRRAAARHVDFIRGGALSDLLDPEVMGEAWR
ncbi:MAG TPA: type II toxin-antitoxin system VapB family antitoxin [Mycobacteriales bacterium]|nr:type II toxin-antitoxin system VapB family antitoxin [Mycobacteriales bacterium]